MRVLLVTSGSTGDVAPYTGLARRLQQAGHDVTMAAHPPFETRVTALGIPFRPIPGDLTRVLPHAPGQDGRTCGTGPLALARLQRLARPLIAEMGDGIAAAAEAARPDVLLLSTVVAPLGYQVAQAAGVPWAGVFLQPVAPTGDFGSVLLGGRSLGRPVNRGAAAAAAWASQSLYAGPVRRLRAKLGLPHEPVRTLRTWQDGGRWPAFHGFSPAVVPRPADWRPQLEVVGYWWPAVPDDWAPPAELTDFLGAGPPPVFIGFGSMGPGQGERLSEAVLEAVRRAGVRAVVQAGWAGLDVRSADVLTIGEAPHAWLFPRTAAVVHHAGAGTTAAGLRAGVPAVPVPVLADQPFWAGRLHRLGAATAPLPMRRLTAERLAAALREVTTNPHRAARAQAVAARLRVEDGAARVLEWLASLPSAR